MARVVELIACEAPGGMAPVPGGAYLIVRFCEVELVTRPDLSVVVAVVVLQAETGQTHLRAATRRWSWQSMRIVKCL